MKSYNFAVVAAGGYEKMSCMETDCRNYVDKMRRLRLEKGDAVVIQSYFSKMQAQCLNFLFSMDLDDNLLLKNVFWTDNHSRQAYKEFDNIVSFYIPYLTNKYAMPFTLLLALIITDNQHCLVVIKHRTE